MGSKKKAEPIKKSVDCDDFMFMCSEIKFEYLPNRELQILEMEFEPQCGRGPAFIRLEELDELIKTLQFYRDTMWNKVKPKI